MSPLGSISSTISIPAALLGQGKADRELLQRHSTDSAGAGKSQLSSWDGRRSATYWSSLWQVSKLRERWVGKYDAADQGQV